MSDMSSPCTFCYIHGREYSERCDDTCEFAYTLKVIREGFPKVRTKVNLPEINTQRPIELLTKTMEEIINQ